MQKGPVQRTVGHRNTTWALIRREKTVDKLGVQELQGLCSVLFLHQVTGKLVPAINPYPANVENIVSS